MRYRKNPARGKRPEERKLERKSERKSERKIAQPQARASATATRVVPAGKSAKPSVRSMDGVRRRIGFAASSRRWNGLAVRNLVVGSLAVATMMLAVYGAVLRPQVVPFSDPARDASGNEVARASDRVPVSQSFPEDGFDFDRAAIDAVIKPAPGTPIKAPARASPAAPAGSVTIVTYANGDAVPTDPVRFAAPEPRANGAGDGRQARARVASDQRDSAVSPATAGAAFNGAALIAEARRYLGTNPTKRATLWCGAFLDMVLRRTGHRGGGNLALGYARYGKRISGPKVGAIVVLRRNGGGHVGIVTGVDSNGNPIVISGNHNHRVAVATYPRSRVVAYVVP